MINIKISLTDHKFIELKSCNEDMIDINSINIGITNIEYKTEGYWNVDDKTIFEMRAARRWLMFCPFRIRDKPFEGQVSICGFYNRNISFFKKEYHNMIESSLIKFLLLNNLRIVEFEENDDEIINKHLSPFFISTYKKLLLLK